MNQIPNKKPSKKGQEAVIRVVLDEAELHKMLDPILTEVNSQRRRIDELEKNYVELVGENQTLTARLERFLDDGK